MEKKIKSKVRTKHHRGRRKNKTPRKIMSDIVLVVAIVVFLFSGYKLYSIFSEYKKGADEYENIAETVLVPIQSESDQNTDVEDKPEEQRFAVDFGKLQEMNKDVVSWIRFDESQAISYPVVQGPDNSKYLYTTFEGKRNAAGTLFIDYKNSKDFTDSNTFIYGHNMKNGSMFGQLRKYKSSDFCSENPFFYIYTPDGNCAKYQVFSVCIVEDASESYHKQYSDDKEFEEYISYVRGLSLYSVDVEVNAGSKIVSLSTCTNVSDEERLLIHAVKISEEMVEE